MYLHDHCFDYRKVASSRLSQLVPHIRIIRRLMKGKFDAYVLWPLAKKFQNWIIDSRLYGVSKEKSLGTNFNQENWMIVIWLLNGPSTSIAEFLTNPLKTNLPLILIISQLIFLFTSKTFIHFSSLRPYYGNKQRKNLLWICQKFW